MAARINHKYSEDLRKKIKAAMIINRLQQHFEGEIELTLTQIKAGTELLDRAVPKLSQVQSLVDVSGEVSITHKIG